MDTPDEDASRERERVIDKVFGWARHLIDPDQCVELRCLRVQDGGSASVHSGWFQGTDQDLREMVSWALNYSNLCGGVYYTLNPLKDRWGKRLKRVDTSHKGEAATDADVLERRWLLIDVDPTRAKGFEKQSATDAEKAAAWDTLGQVREYLAREHGYPPPIVSDSGNGYHLLYRVSGDDGGPVLASAGDGLLSDEVKKMLYHLAAKFDTQHATVDRSVHNPSRIVKFPGTHACKGEATDERPHRRAKVIEIPGVYPVIANIDDI